MLDVGDMTGILMKIVLLNVPTPPPPRDSSAQRLCLRAANSYHSIPLQHTVSVCEPARKEA